MAKKLTGDKKKIAVLKRELEEVLRLKRIALKDNIHLEGKVEGLESKSKTELNLHTRRRNRLETEIEFLRKLIREVTVPTETLKVLYGDTRIELKGDHY